MIIAPHTSLSAERLTMGVFATLLTMSSSAQLTVDLTASNYNGFNISCFGKKDGSIDATVSGGTPPYSYTWSNGLSTQDISDLASGYYSLKVVDAAYTMVVVDITLVEPQALTLTAEPFKYPGGTNISCYNCFNGSIDVTVVEGVPPYSYVWDDGPTTQDRSGLGALTYSVLVTDANGCEAVSQKLLLTQPERSDWTMTGNTGTNPATHYIGTADAQDVVFKSNGQEIIRLENNGNIRLGGTLAGTGLLQRDATGVLKLLRYDPAPPNPCSEEPYPLWLTSGNNLTTCTGCAGALGSADACPLRLMTNGVERMHITPQGRVVIGTNATPLDQFEVHTTLERGGITLVNRQQNNQNAHTEIRFRKDEQQRWALGCDHLANGGQDFFLWDAIVGAHRLIVNAEGKVGIGTAPPTNNSLYKLYVEGGIATRDIKVKTGLWPDYVFDTGYDLMSMSDLRAFVQRNRHLPGIPSASEVDADGGVEIGDLQRRMLETIEQQALYILQLEERLQQLEQRVTTLQTSR
jgi:hypothetical protein